MSDNEELEDDDFPFEEGNDLAFAVGEGEEAARRFWGNERYEQIMNTSETNIALEQAVQVGAITRLNAVSAFYGAMAQLALAAAIAVAFWTVFLAVWIPLH